MHAHKCNIFRHFDVVFDAKTVFDVSLRAFSLPIVIIIIIVIIKNICTLYRILIHKSFIFLIFFALSPCSNHIYFFPLFSLGLLFSIFFVYLSLKIVCQTIRMNRFTACTLYIALTRKNAKCSNKFLQTVIIILSVAFFSLFHSLCLSLFLSICASTAVVHSFCGNLTQTCCYCRSFFIHFDNKLAALTWLYASVHFGLPLWCAVSISVLEFLVSI